MWYHLNKHISNRVTSLILLLVDVVLLAATHFFNIVPSEMRLVVVVLGICLFLEITVITQCRKLSPFAVFLGFFIIAQFGRVFLVAFVPSFVDVDLGEAEVLSQSIKMSLYSALALHMGSILVNVFSATSTTEQKYNNDQKDDTRNIKHFAYALLVISIGPLIYTTRERITAAISGGYSEVLASRNIGLASIPDRLSMWFVTAIFLFVASSRRPRVVLAIGCIYMIARMAFGGRGIETMTIISLLLFYQTKIKPFSKKQILFGVITSIPLIVVMAQIYTLRNQSLGQWDFLATSDSPYARGTNPFYSLIWEYGAAIRPTAVSINLYTLNMMGPYFGLTYLCSIATMIPDPFKLWSSDFRDLAAIAQTIADRANAGSIGGSLVEEAYINFGPLIVPFFIILGMLIQRLSNSLYRSTNMVYSALLSVVFVYVYWSSRNSLGVIFQSTAYYVLVPYLIYIFLIRRHIPSQNNALKSSEFEYLPQ